MVKKTKKCKKCSDDFKPFNTLQKYCSAKCMKQDKGFKQIKKVSDKRQTQIEVYTQLRKVFLNKQENKICPITKEPTIEVHHTYCGKDRAKFYLDTTTWLAVSRNGHNWIHNNPKEAREQGFLK